MELDEMVREYRTALMQLVRRKQELLQWMHRFDRRIGVLEEEIEEVADVLYPVSYTHLDVYKRQV